MDTGFVFGLIPIAGIAILAFFIIGFNNDAKFGGRGKGLLSGFSYSVSVAMLGILIGSGVVALNVGLKTTVFQKADSLYSRGTPPPVYPTPSAPEKAAPTCAESCDLTADQKQFLNMWANEYQSWQDTAPGTDTRNRTDLVTALSFFFVALPLFIIFFRTVQREAKRGQAIPGMRSFYFYGIAVVGLLMAVTSGAFLINTGLRGAFIPNASKMMPTPAFDSTSVSNVQSVVACGEKCALPAETVSAAQAWLAETQNAKSETSTTQRDLAGAIPVFIIGLPLFLYHFITIRRETHKDTPAPTNQGATA